MSAGVFMDEVLALELVERNLPSPHDIRDFIEQVRHTHIRGIRKQ